MAEEKVLRNAELYHDHKSGMSTVDMVVKYRVSPQRIYYLVKDYQKKMVVDNDIKTE